MKAHLRLEALENTRTSRFHGRRAGIGLRSRLSEYIILGLVVAVSAGFPVHQFGMAVRKTFKEMTSATHNHPCCIRMQAESGYQTTASVTSISRADRNPVSDVTGDTSTMN